MELGNEIMKVLNKTYEPSTMIETQFKRYDIAFKTDEEGRPILLFMGKKDNKGNIKGERFARRLKVGPNGEVIKDHWENKGKAS
ncbi:hypothetical protein EOD41_00685 [Mucilaginibacter limnophilus]|uniref:Uncharacterized protein n=1 Tax=Mucilaginibacter limnophilus TaxID=1932778 RepID=A0A3S2V3L7_9SPHI|nr:hypothetical protein [Mucilaginibacter limnophilus]RVU02489.1 hypothetical protein EOD41_00685 [Mucilaginibacter limnophilus]